MTEVIIDFDGFMENVGLEYEGIGDLYSIFIDEITKEKENMKKYMSLGKFDELSRVIHNIKGVSGNYRALNIFEVSRIIDEKLKQKDNKNLHYYIIALSELIEESISVINRYFNK